MVYVLSTKKTELVFLTWYRQKHSFCLVIFSMQTSFSMSCIPVWTSCRCTVLKNPDRNISKKIVPPRRNHSLKKISIKKTCFVLKVFMNSSQKYWSKVYILQILKKTNCSIESCFFLMKKGRGVARDKSMSRHHYSRGVQGHAPSEIFDIQYHRSCILKHFKACFEGFFIYILQRLQRRYTYRSIYSFLNVNSPHKSRR